MWDFLLVLDTVGRSALEIPQNEKCARLRYGKATHEEILGMDFYLDKNLFPHLALHSFLTFESKRFSTL